MIKQLLAKLLMQLGCEVTIDGDILTATRGGSEITFFFLREKNVDNSTREEAGGHSIIVPLSEEFSEEDAKGLQVMKRELIEDVVLETLLGKRSPEDTPIGELINNILGGAPIKEAVVRPTITPEEVKEIGKKTVKGFSYTLQLVPYYLFDYITSVENERGTHESAGRIGVNALTGVPDVWEKNLELVECLEYFDKKQEPRTNEREAFRIAQEYASELGTVIEEKVRRRGKAIIEEERKIRPGREDVEIKVRGMVYLPIWCVEGSEGSLIINASSGKILKEDTYP